MLARHDVILPREFQNRVPLPARVAGRILRIFGGGAKGRPGERLARALEKLGPAYVKLGQFLATRPDVFGPEIAGDLSRLKDRLPSFELSAARAALDEEFGAKEAARLFPELSAPVAAASLAQVHKIETPQGPRAVKILRPGIEGMIMNEMRAIQRAARTVEGLSAESRRLRPSDFTATVAASMAKELDLRLEAGAADEMYEASIAEGYFTIPRVDWARTGRRVLTTDWVDGLSLTNQAALGGPNIDRKTLANNITRGFLSHAIKHGVFHADMHEGNMIVTPDGALALVDFGIIGRVGMTERRFLAEILWGFIQRDYMRIAQVHFEAGYVPQNQSVGDFAQALRSIGEPLVGKNASEMSMGKVLLQLFDYTHTFGMSLRPELVLMQKTMVQVEGVARSIDPEHDIWNAAEPIVKDWISANLGPEGAARLVAENVREISDRLKRLPDVMDRFEASLDTPPPPPAKERFAPWWGWFGLALAAGGLCVYALRFFA